jgi:predicted ATPase
VPGALASVLGLALPAEDPVPGLLAGLKDKRMLLVLDNCEHVIETLAALAERLFKEAPQIHILATSRESLRVEGERVHRLFPLACPPEDATLNASELFAFPAARLFIERAAAGSHQFELGDTDAPVVAEICRKLDGIPLAIELAAGRVDAYGIEEIATLLDGRFALLWHGRRTALPRHQTLSAALDWSYDLLGEVERTVLRRLAIFVGVFSLEAALAVVVSDEIDEAQAVGAMGDLVAKSLLFPDTSVARVRYRLLDATRAYLRAKPAGRDEADMTARRRAAYWCQYPAWIGIEATASCDAPRFAQSRALVGNHQAGLERSFTDMATLRLKSGPIASPLEAVLSY